MKVMPGNAQHIGRRPEQQDTFGFFGFADGGFRRHGGVLMVVCDGMGGLANGGIASQVAVDAATAAYAGKSPSESIPAAMRRAVAEAHAAVIHHTNGADQAGTTIVTAVVHADRLYWASVGDSRLYLFRKGCAPVLLTVDDTLATLLDARCERGEISPETAASDPHREALTSFLGSDTPPEPVVNQDGYGLRSGDRVLACSDGLYRALSGDEMASLVLNTQPMQAAERLAEAAMATGNPYQDNITATLFALEDRARIWWAWPAIAGGGALLAATAIGGGLWLWLPHHHHKGVAVDKPNAVDAVTQKVSEFRPSAGPSMPPQPPPPPHPAEEVDSTAKSAQKLAQSNPSPTVDQPAQRASSPDSKAVKAKKSAGESAQKPHKQAIKTEPKGRKKGGEEKDKTKEKTEVSPQAQQLVPTAPVPPAEKQREGAGSGQLPAEDDKKQNEPGEQPADPVLPAGDSSSPKPEPTPPISQGGAGKRVAP
ncbi:PP2C family serine/threonine-protein phosphatase [Azospirillum sp. B4]|uniref:PP2C family protein-serine/threonine phosphatase n=1 Tax=Azospirillum sp. B4 TaxID=95605 RepID=UPI000349DE84|nr:protein phosphatase 2C domain-containing protein [Azospirillum sp. B4]